MADNLAVCDERGRILIPQAIRKEFGKEFHVIKTKDEIILIPVVKDPVKVLSIIGKDSDISRFSMKQIKEEIRKQAMKEL